MNNPVAKHFHKTNKNKVEIDRKKEEDKTGSHLDSSVLVNPTNGDVYTVDTEEEE